MQKSKVIEILADHDAELRRMGVRYLALFGSTARSDSRKDSDVDLLVELERPAGLFKLAEVQAYLEGILGCNVDLGTPDSLKPRLRERVLSEAQRVA